MPRLNEIAGDVPSQSTTLNELYLRDEPVIVITFTDEADEMNLHFENDPSSRGWLQCIADGCPYCLMGSKPSKFFFMPVYNIETRRVEVLRVSPLKGPGALLSVLMNHIARPDAGNCTLVLVRNDKHYSGASKPLVPGTDNGRDVVARFKEAIASGLTIGSVVRRLTRAEIEVIPRLRPKLEVLGLLSEETRPEAQDNGEAF